MDGHHARPAINGGGKIPPGVQCVWSELGASHVKHLNRIIVRNILRIKGPFIYQIKSTLMSVSVAGSGSILE